MKLLSFVLVAFLGVLGNAGMANAAMIDFGSADWSGANGQGTFAVGGVTASAAPGNAKLAHTPGVGLGVNHTLIPGIPDLDPNEIDLVEVLTISFSPAAAVKQFTVSRLFADEGQICFGNFCFGGFDERGQYQLDGQAPIGFEAVSTNGLLTVHVGSAPVSSISFSIENGSRLRNDYALQSIETVPEPASLALLGLACVGGAARLRRRR